MGALETCVRDVLGEAAPRRMAVLRPLKVVLTNYPEDQVELMEAMNHPANPDFGTRELPFSRELWIEQDDFMEDAPRKFFRLKPGGEVRLRFGYIIRCDEVIKNDDGGVVELRCSYDPDTRSGTGTSDRKVKGTIHWVSCAHAVDASVRLYDRLFTDANPGLFLQGFGGRCRGCSRIQPHRDAARLVGEARKAGAAGTGQINQVT
jgi:glutaminyl-tRNA synthetase